MAKERDGIDDIFAFLAKTHDALPETISVGDDSILISQLGDVPISLSVEGCNPVEEMGVFGWLRETYCYAVSGCVPFTCSEGFLWSNKGSTGWFRYA